MAKEINQPKPNLFIVGAPKSGTTFLYERLKNNEELFFPKIKELNFFSYNILNKKSYYRDFKIKEKKKYLKFYNFDKKKYYADCSVSYFAFPVVAKNIYDFNPNAKIIIIVRDPYKRAFSHYLMDKRMGYAKKDFIKYISNEMEYPFHYHQYINNSLYYKNIKNYEELFGKSNVLVLNLEKIEKDLGRIYSFLNIEKRLQDINFNEVVNQSKAPRNIFGKFLQKNRNITERIKLLFPKSISKNFNNFLYKNGNSEKISDEAILKLNDLLKNDYENFKKKY